MGEQNERNRDKSQYLSAVETRLRAKPCQNGRRKKRGGCVGVHDDCKNQTTLDKIRAKAEGDKFFTPPPSHRIDVSDSDLETRIKRLEAYYAGKPPVFEPEEDADPINERGLHGSTPLHVNVEENNYAEVTRLLALGADPMIRDNNGHTPFQVAQLLGLQKMLRLLKRHGVTE